MDLGGAGDTGRVLIMPSGFQSREMTAVLLGQCDEEDEAALILLKLAVLSVKCKD